MEPKRSNKRTRVNVYELNSIKANEAPSIYWLNVFPRIGYLRWFNVALAALFCTKLIHQQLLILILPVATNMALIGAKRAGRKKGGMLALPPDLSPLNKVSMIRDHMILVGAMGSSQPIMTRKNNESLIRKRLRNG